MIRSYGKAKDTTMKLIAKHIPILKELRQYNPQKMILEAYSQNDLEAVKHLQSLKDTKADFYAGKFFIDCCGFTIEGFERVWNDLEKHWK